LLLLQLTFLVAFLVLCVTAGPWRNANATLAVIAGMFGVAAMAVQNALVQISLGNTPTTAVMTTNVTHFMLDLGEVLFAGDPAEVAKARGRAMHTLPVIVGFAIGCGLGAAGEAAAGLWSLALPASLALLAFAMGQAGKHPPLPAKRVIAIIMGLIIAIFISYIATDSSAGYGVRLDSGGDG